MQVPDASQSPQAGVLQTSCPRQPSFEPSLQAWLKTASPWSRSIAARQEFVMVTIHNGKQSSQDSAGPNHHLRPNSPPKNSRWSQSTTGRSRVEIQLDPIPTCVRTDRQKNRDGHDPQWDAVGSRFSWTQSPPASEQPANKNRAGHDSQRDAVESRSSWTQSPPARRNGISQHICNLGGLGKPAQWL